MKYVSAEEFDKVVAEHNARVKATKKVNNLKAKWRNSGSSLTLAGKLAALDKAQGK